jgi:hypothetical protein
VSRKRYLSTNISTDPRLRDLARDAGEFAALLYTWMIPHAADDGLISSDPDELLMLVVPGFRWRTPEDVRQALSAMEQLELVQRVDRTHVRFPPTAFYRYQAYVKPDRRSTSQQPEISGLFPEVPGTSAESLASSSFPVSSSIPVSLPVLDEVPGGMGGETPSESDSSYAEGGPLPPETTIYLVGEHGSESVPPDPEPSESDPPPAAVDHVLAVYQHFKTRIQPGSRLCPRDKIRLRLKHFAPDELVKAIDHFAEDWWWMENNATRGAEWFFHSDQRVEQFVNMTPRPLRPAARAAPVQPYGGSHSWAAAAMVPTVNERMHA